MRGIDSEFLIQPGVPRQVDRRYLPRMLSFQFHDDLTLTVHYAENIESGD